VSVGHVRAGQIVALFRHRRCRVSESPFRNIERRASNFTRKSRAANFQYPRFGAQALLGFQLTVTLTRTFSQLSSDIKIAHALALCCVALAVILLMAPASLHRLAFAGEDDPGFVKIGSIFVVAAPLPLALGIALDTYVAARRALQSDIYAAVLAGFGVLFLLATWYGYPLWRRTIQRRR
jgi:hypothetical protein